MFFRSFDQMEEISSCNLHMNSEHNRRKQKKIQTALAFVSALTAARTL